MCCLTKPRARVPFKPKELMQQSHRLNKVITLFQYVIITRLKADLAGSLRCDASGWIFWVFGFAVILYARPRKRSLFIHANIFGQIRTVCNSKQREDECVTVVVWSGTRDSGTSLSQSWLAFGRSSMSMDWDTDSLGICGRGIWLVG